MIEEPESWSFKIVPAVHGYYGDIDLEKTKYIVLARLYERDPEELWTKCQVLLFLQEKISRTFTSILRHDPTEGDGRHIQLRREEDGSVTLTEILRHNHKLRSLIGIRAPMLLAALFDTAKLLTREDSKDQQIHLDGTRGPLNHDRVPYAPITAIYLKPAQGQTAREVPSHPEGDGSSSQPAYPAWTKKRSRNPGLDLTLAIVRS